MPGQWQLALFQQLSLGLVDQKSRSYRREPECKLDTKPKRWDESMLELECVWYLLWV